MKENKPGPGILGGFSFRDQSGGNPVAISLFVLMTYR